MTKKFSEARNAAFLRAFSETGNQPPAPERATGSRSRAQLHHTEAPAFHPAELSPVALPTKPFPHSALPGKPQGDRV